MDLKRFGCQDDPFAEALDRRYVYFDDHRRRVQEEIIGSIGRTSGLIVLTGEAGAGKTTMLHCLFEDIVSRTDCFLLSSMPWLTCRQGTTLRELAEVFSYARCLARSGNLGLEEHFGAGLASGDRAGLARGPGGKRLAGIILDDAHRLAPQVLVQFRRWRRAFQSVRGPLSVILTATSEEDNAEAGGIEGFPSAAGSRDIVIRLRPFNCNGTQQLIDHRLQVAGYANSLLFSPEAAARVFDYAEGNPSRTMRLCRRAVALAADDCGLVSVTTIDAAAQIEVLPRPNLKQNAVSRWTSAVSLAKVSDLPPAPCMPPYVLRDGLDKEITTSELSGCFSPVLSERKAFRRRVLDFASVTTSMVTVLAVGWFYVAERDAGVHPIAALETTISAGVTAAIARVQPSGDQRATDLPGQIARSVDASVSAASKVPPREVVEAPRRRDLDQAMVSGMSVDGDQQMVSTTDREAVAVDPEPPEQAVAPSPPPDARALVAESEPPEAEAKMTPAVEELLGRGNRLLELGDIAGARLFYAMAAGQGSAEGALLMGVTFDPLYFEQRNIRGTRPQVLEAVDWYERAAALGSAAAEERKSALASRLRVTVQDGDEDARRAFKLLFDLRPQ